MQTDAHSLIEVVKPGLATSVQDMGRQGYYHVGIPPSSRSTSTHRVRRICWSATPRKPPCSNARCSAPS